MPITTSSAKAKGRKLQQWTRDLILHKFPKLAPDDVKSTSMGAQGEDIQLSPAARLEVPYSIECKARRSIGVYSFFEQAAANAGSHEPLLIIKANRKEPLAVVYADHYFEMLKQLKRLSKNDKKA